MTVAWALSARPVGDRAPRDRDRGRDGAGDRSDEDHLSGHDSLHRAAASVATYAQRIKNQSGKPRKTAARPAAKARPAAASSAEPAAAPRVELGELQGLKDELQRVNQEISRLARVSRPDAGRQSNLPEKQELLRQKIDLERKIRARPKAQM